MENFAEIYETMLGFRTPEACVPGVEDAFSEGSLCQREYDRMRGAYDGSVPVWAQGTRTRT